MLKGDFEKIQESAKHGVLFTKFAYATSDEDHRVFNDMAAEIAPDHELLLFSDFLDDTKKFEYRCAVFISHKDKSIVFANAGTRPHLDKKGFYDVLDDMNLLLQMEPYKLKSAANLNSMVLDSLEGETKNYSFCYTGHSLGAAMADLAAADMELQLLSRAKQAKKISTLTFDNPGTKPIIDKMFRKKFRKKKFDSSKSCVDYVSINSKTSVFNTVNPQAGRVFKLALNKEKSFDYTESIISCIARYIKKNIKGFAPSCITKVCSWISYGSVARQLENHKLANFENIIIWDDGGKVRSLDEIIAENLKELPYNKKVFDHLSFLKQMNKSIGKQEYIMKSTDDIKIQFSKTEYTAVLAVLQYNLGNNTSVHRGKRLKNPLTRNSSRTI